MQELVISHVIMLNWYPVKNGVSKHCSPMTIVTGRKLDCKKHCMTEFGAHVQANNENKTTNDLTERCPDAIYLRPNTEAELSAGRRTLTLIDVLAHINQRMNLPQSSWLLQNSGRWATLRE